MVDKAKVLLISNRIPTNENAGGILYSQIIESHGDDNFDIVSVSRILSKEQAKNSLVKSNRFRQFGLRVGGENIFSKIFRKISLLDYFYFKINYYLKKDKIINHIVDLNPDKILIAMRGESIIVGNLILEKFSEKNIEFIGFVEDTVEREVEENLLLYREKKRKYYSLLGSLNRLGVAGESMREYFESDFTNKPIIVRPWHFDNTSKELNLEKEDKLNVFFAGNIYAKREFDFFLDVLDLIGSKGIEVNFYVATNKLVKSSSKNFNLLNLGWVSEKELVEYMKKCNLAYLPYKSEEKFKHSMMHAFPGKAGLYISNNLPVFFHGPSYSSFNTFLKKCYRVGFSSDELTDKTKVYELFISEFFPHTKQIEYANNCRTAYQTKFSSHVFDESVQKLLN